MIKPTIFTWILVIFGFITLMPLFFAQMVMLRQPHSKKARDLLIGKGENWRDKSHFRSAYGLALADWIIEMPLVISGTAGVILGRHWGYILWATAGAIMVYINIFLWFFEKEYVYPAVGPLAYYTYIWGNFMYWGTAAFAYALLRLNGITF